MRRRPNRPGEGVRLSEAEAERGARGDACRARAAVSPEGTAQLSRTGARHRDGRARRGRRSIARAHRGAGPAGRSHPGRLRPSRRTGSTAALPQAPAGSGAAAESAREVSGSAVVAPGQQDRERRADGGRAGVVHALADDGRGRACPCGSIARGRASPRSRSEHGRSALLHGVHRSHGAQRARSRRRQHRAREGRRPAPLGRRRSRSSRRRSCRTSRGSMSRSFGAGTGARISTALFLVDRRDLRRRR